jgi:DMSO reductase anchor subunit
MSSIMNEQGVGDQEVISPTKQSEWAWPAVANFILGGAGSGFYLLSVATRVLESGRTPMVPSVTFGLLAPALVGFGFLFLAIEAGRPFRGCYLFGSLKSAWISREALAFTIFVPAVVLDHFFPHSVFKMFATLSALIFMITQGFIVYSARAIPAWNVFIMPLFFFSSGLATGSGLALFLAATGGMTLEGGLVMLSLISIMLNLSVWLFYLHWSSARDFRSATKPLSHPLMVLVTIALGHMLPILLLLLLKYQALTGMRIIFPCILMAISGLSVLIGVSAQKIGVILFSGYHMRICLRFSSNAK